MSSDPLHIHRLNDWIAGSKRRPKRKKLFGDFWLERELAILFAEPEWAKASSLSNRREHRPRRPHPPFQMTAKPQKVLILISSSTMSSSKLRYSADPDEINIPSKNTTRFFLKPLLSFRDRIEGEVPADFASFEEYLRSTIERGIRQNGARVVIIDNLTYIRGPHDTARHAIPLMRGLLRLKKELGLSILVLAHTPKRDTARRITVHDLQGSKFLSNFADNIFAIGSSNIDTASATSAPQARAWSSTMRAMYPLELKNPTVQFSGFVFVTSARKTGIFPHLSGVSRSSARD